MFELTFIDCSGASNASCWIGPRLSLATINVTGWLAFICTFWAFNIFCQIQYICQVAKGEESYLGKATTIINKIWMSFNSGKTANGRVGKDPNNRAGTQV